MYREATPAEQAILDYFDEHEDIFDSAIEEIDNWDGYLGDDRYFNMEELPDLLSDTNPADLLRMAFNGYAEDGGAFNPNQDYFTFNGYGNLVSAWEKDYSDHLDLYFIDALFEHRGDLYTVDDDPDLSDLLDALETERAGSDAGTISAA